MKSRYLKQWCHVTSKKWRALEDINGFETNNPFHTKGLSFITQVIILKYFILKHILQSIFIACLLYKYSALLLSKNSLHRPYISIARMHEKLLLDLLWQCNTCIKIMGWVEHAFLYLRKFSLDWQNLHVSLKKWEMVLLKNMFHKQLQSHVKSSHVSTKEQKLSLLSLASFQSLIYGPRTRIIKTLLTRILSKIDLVENVVW